MTTRASAIARHGRRGETAVWLVISARPLPRAGGPSEEIVPVVGRRPEIEVGEDGGEPALVDGHATCPPATLVGLDDGSGGTLARMVASE